jgi:hypothetical protein
LIIQAVTTNDKAERRQAPIARRFETSLCLPAVRGLRLSISQSARRLKVIAAVRAKTIAMTTSANTRNEGSP